MKQSGNRYKYELVSDGDSQELLEIMEEESSPGNISLVYTRRPDAIKSFEAEGEKTTIVVCRDLKKNVIAGFGVLTLRKLYINKQEQKVGYLFGVKVRKEYQKKIRIDKGFELLKKMYSDIPIHYTTILGDNYDVQRMFEKKRDNLPWYIPCGHNNFYVLKTGNKIKSDNHYRIKRCTKEDIDQMIFFCNEHGKEMQLFPVMSKKDLVLNSTLRYEDFYLLFKNEELVACGAVWDQKSYKQLYVKDYSGLYRCIYLFPSLFNLFGYPKLGKKGSRVNYFSLANWFVKNNSVKDFKVFIHEISTLTSNYSYFVVGVHQNNMFNDVLRKMTKLVYKSKLYLVNWNHHKEIDFNKGLIPYIESGAL